METLSQTYIYILHLSIHLQNKFKNNIFIFFGKPTVIGHCIYGLEAHNLPLVLPLTSSLSLNTGHFLVLYLLASLRKKQMRTVRPSSICNTFTSG